MHWVIAAVVVVAAAAAVVVTAGGAAPALLAVATVASGCTAGSATMAAGVFIGSAAVLGTAALTSAMNSNSLQDFADQGNWGTVASTIVGGALGWASVFGSTKSSSSTSTTNKTSNISSADAKRIQNAANKTKQTITVVGSRANGTAEPNSDWDYIMSGNSAQRHAAASSVPRGVFGGENNSGIDIFSSYINGPNPVMIDRSKAYIEFFPE